jgi:inorganic pyrophosphatase
MTQYLTNAERQQAVAYLEAQPGQRGRDIPTQFYDQMMASASGITLPLWGTKPTPQHMQALWDAKATTPEKIKGLFDQMPHPKAPNVKVGDYQDYQQALQVFNENRK